MKLEQQVVSLELAKKLKELGVKQESLFYWRPNDNGAGNFNDIIVAANDEEGLFCGVYYSAFTVAELGEMLPDYAHSWRIPAWKDDTIKWQCDWKNKPSGSKTCDADTEADARAKMLIYLKENNL